MSAIRNILFAAGFATLGAFMAVGAQAAAGPHRGGAPFGPQMARLAADLDLTDEQQAMVDEMKSEARAQMQEKRADHESQKEELRAMLSQETIDAEAVHTMIDDRVSEMAGFAHDMADRFIALHATLDEEQRASLIEKLEEAGERHQERRQRFEERGGDIDR